MRDLKLIILFLVYPFLAFSQDESKYWVFFKDKPVNISQADPSAFLSQKALERRKQQGISVQFSDMPVNTFYIESISDYGKIAHVSRWFNAISAYIPKSSLAQIESLPFVSGVELVEVYRARPPVNLEPRPNKDASVPLSQPFYGQSFDQVEMLKGNYLHQKNYLGDGIIIGLMDSGYKNANQNRAFTKVFNENRILGTQDFVDDNTGIFNKYSHGSNVLSVLAAYLPGEYVGSAPNSSYYLFRTEISGSETILEEDNWVAAAEAADQFGVDVINSSLGYSIFDDMSDNHEYADMDGNTTIITKAADMAAKKGILVVVSAGNEGNDPWFYITAPADGDSVIAVGSVNASEQVSDFSSRGPSSDGDVKPNVCAQGENTVVVNTEGFITTLNGTSFAAPLIAGFAACLWQAFPEKTNMEIMQAIEQSADLLIPNDECGYGIPDFEMAFNILANDLIGILDGRDDDLLIAPNPVKDNAKIFYRASNDGTHFVGIYDMTGKQLFLDEMYLFAGQYNKINLDLTDVSSGTYMVRILQGDSEIKDLLIKTK